MCVWGKRANDVRNNDPLLFQRARKRDTISCPFLALHPSSIPKGAGESWNFTLMRT